MAQFDFPSSPSTNQTYTSNGVTYKWDGVAWRRVNTTGAQGGTGSTGPTGPTGGVGAKPPMGSGTFDSLNVTGIATFHKDVEFIGAGDAGIKSTFWDQSASSLKFLDGVK